MGKRCYGDRSVRWTGPGGRRSGAAGPPTDVTANATAIVPKILPKIVTAIVPAIVVVIASAACGSTRDAVPLELVTGTDGVLSVAASLPAPGFWDVDAHGAPEGGFEWALATALAERFDLRLEVVDVSFERIAAGDLGGADLALAQVEITSERDEVVDFSVPYLDSDLGVLVRTGDEIRDLASARQLDWVAVVSSTGERFLRDTVSPDPALQLAANEAEAAAMVALEHADAALIDLVTALIVAADQGALDVTGRFVTGGQYAIVMPSGSPNQQLIDAAVRAFDSDGTLDRLEQDWLVSAFDRSLDDVRVIRSR